MWDKRLVYLFCLLIIFILPSTVQAAIFEPMSSVAIVQNLDHAQQQLVVEQQKLNEEKELFANLITEKTKQWQQLSEEGLPEEILNQTQLAIINAQAKYENLNIALIEVEETLHSAMQSLIILQQRHFATRTDKRVVQAEQLLELQKKLKMLIDTEQQREKVLINLQELAKKRQKLLSRWINQLIKLQQNQLLIQKGIPVQANFSQIKEKQKFWIKKINETDQQISKIDLLDPQAQQKIFVLQFKEFFLQENISLSQLSLLLEKLRERIHPELILNPEIIPIMELNKRTTEVKYALQELDKAVTVVKRKIKEIQQQKQIILDYKNQVTQSNIKNQIDVSEIDQLLKSYQIHLQLIKTFQNQIQELNDELEKIHLKQFSVRQTLPGWNITAWKTLGQEVLQLPLFLWYALQDLAIQVIHQLKMLNNLTLYFLSFIVVVSVVIWFYLKRTFLELLEILEEKSKRYSGKVLTVLLHILRRNLTIIFIILFILGLLFFLNLDITLWFLLGVIFLIYRIADSLVRLWLLESEEDVSGKDVRLYYQLKWIISLASIFTLFMFLTSIFPIGAQVRVLFSKLLMLLLLMLSYLLFRYWLFLPVLIKRIFSVQRIYIMRVINLVCAVVPITLLTNALIGLIGYAELAWTFGKYQAIALMTLIIYMIARGLLTDLMELIVEFLIRHHKSGLLLANAFVKPLDHVLRILLFIFAIWTFIVLVGLNKNGMVLNYWNTIMNANLISFLGNAVTFPLLIKIVIFLFFLYWIAKWSREFSFRWMYLKARDIGLRNSLAVFTQYAVIIIAVVLGLRILGFDMTGLAVVAAAFAAGLGFGLRDLISNFFSGILLLIERPFRVGDTISVGEFEGEVMATGVRSMKIRTWDHMEVIIPNSDIFTKAFVNWTHQDSIVRSVIKIKIQRVDNPHHIQSLILTLLNKLPSVVEEPIPEVFMHEISESLIEMEVRFFVNLQIEKSRARVRSEVLFAIWDCFKENYIHSPYPQYDINLIDQKRNNKI